MEKNSKIFVAIEYVNGKPNAVLGTFSSYKKAFNETIANAQELVDTLNDECEDYDDRRLIDMVDEEGVTNLAFRIGYESEVFRDKKPSDEIYEYEIKEYQLDSLCDSSNNFGELSSPLDGVKVNVFPDEVKEDVRNFYETMYK